MSRKHKDWTDEERRAAAAVTHADNRLKKIDSLVLGHKNEIERLKVEQKRLKEVVKNAPTPITADRS